MVRIQRLGMFLEAHFGEVEYHMPDEDMEAEQEEPTPHGEPSFLIQLDDAEARINLLSMVRPSLSVPYILADVKYAQTVNSSSEVLRRRVEGVLEMALSTVSSLSESFLSGAPEEFSSGRIYKQKGDVPVRSSDGTDLNAEKAASDDGGKDSEVNQDQDERLPQEVETVPP